MVNGELYENWLSRLLGSGTVQRGRPGEPADDGGPGHGDHEAPSTGTSVPITRREWLVSVSAAAMAPGAAVGDARADDSSTDADGYGAGMYGDDGYGSPAEDSPADEDESVTVTTMDVADVSATSARLRGEVTELSGADEVTGWFEWGEPGGETKTTAHQTLTSVGSFDEEVTGLDSDTEYEFRAVAEAVTTTDVGDIHSFTTPRLETEPEILRLVAEDTSNPLDPHADVSVTWEATLDDGDLRSAELTVSNATGVVRRWTYDLDGQTVDESENERLHRGGGESYTVELTVYSEHGTSETEQEIFEAS